jgi:hypothetical protein
MKIGVGTDDLRHPLERAAAFHLPVLQFVHVAEVAIGQCLVRQRPQSLGWLQLGRIRGQEVHMNSRGQLHPGTHMPASTVEYQQDLLAVSRAHRVGELAERERERRQRHGGQEEPPCAAGPWVYKGVKVAPLVAVLDGRPRALSARAPYAAHDGLEPDAVLVGGPELYGILGERVLERLDGGRERFLKVA